MKSRNRSPKLASLLLQFPAWIGWIATLSAAVQHEAVRDKFGQYAVRFITENMVVSEIGRLVPHRDRGCVLAVEGQYSYIGDDGNVYFTGYKAGVDGFRPRATHLPRPVPAARIPRIK